MATLGDSWYLVPVELDSANGYVPDMRAHAGDANGRGIDLSVTEGGKPASMTGMAVYLAWGHEDGGEGLTPFTATDAANGRWKALFPTSMQRRGTVLARVMIYLAGSKTPITGSLNFRVFVDVDPVDGNTAISDNDFSVFQRAVADLNEATKAANAAEAKRAAAEKSRASAESARALSESARASEFAALKRDSQAATSNASSSAAAAQGAASNANAAANTALAIANSVAAGSAGDNEIAAMKSEIVTLGHQVAELSGSFVVVGETVYAPSAKASASGETVTLPTSTASGETIKLS